MSDGFAGRYEVLEDRRSGRRTWSPEVKLRIVAESHAPGAMVGEVARRHRLMPSQVTTWRRLHREGKLALVTASPMFVPLMLEDPETGSSQGAPEPVADPEPGPSERIEIEVGGGVVMRLPSSMPTARIAEIAIALREARP